MKHRVPVWACFAVLVALVGVATGVRAEAATVTAGQCVEFNTLTFDPPLTTDSKPGTAVLNFSNTCLDENVSTSPLSQSAGESANSGTITYDYFGSCALALLNDGTVHALIGGSLLVQLRAGPLGRKVVALTPDTPCTDPAGESSASGVGPAFAVSWTL